MSSAGLEFFQQWEGPYSIEEIPALLDYGEERVVRLRGIPNTPVIVKKQEGFIFIGFKHSREIFAVYHILERKVYGADDNSLLFTEVHLDEPSQEIL